MLLQVCRWPLDSHIVYFSASRTARIIYVICRRFLWFADVVSDLRQGQLVKDDFFTLFEAVGALEVCPVFVCSCDFSNV